MPWAPCRFRFAVTSSLRIGIIQEFTNDGSYATTSYAARKRAHFNTASHCNDQGDEFIPMCVEAIGGGWGSNASRVLHEVCKCAACLTGDLPMEKLQQCLQTLPVMLHRANALAIACRALPFHPLTISPACCQRHHRHTSRIGMLHVPELRCVGPEAEGNNFLG